MNGSWSVVCSHVDNDDFVSSFFCCSHSGFHLFSLKTRNDLRAREYTCKGEYLKISADKHKILYIARYRERQVRKYGLLVPLTVTKQPKHTRLFHCGLNSSVLISLLMCLHMILPEYCCLCIAVCCQKIYSIQCVKKKLTYCTTKTTPKLVLIY